MSNLEKLGAVLIVLGMAGLASGCFTTSSDTGTQSFGPPVQAPTIDYEAIVGLDPQTVQTNQERERNNDLEWRVDRLERQVRDLNQITHGVKEIRVGESPDTTPTTDKGPDE